MKRLFVVLTVVVLTLSVAAPEIPLIQQFVGVETAHAQQKRKRKSLFDVLFKRRNIKRNNRANTRTRRPAAGLPGVTLFQRRNERRTTRRNTQPSVAAPKPSVTVVKNEDAKKILVVGDFIASALAKGLEAQYAENPNIIVVDRGRANSGIVRDDVVNWPAVVPEMISQEKPLAVIVLVGMNDRQQMRLPNGRVNKLEDPWKKAYQQRVTNIVTAAAQAQTPLLWVGLPPVKKGAMTADYLVFNEIFRNVTEGAGATFVDVWDGFTNAEGKFVSAGPDINGQIVRLRTGKGINMTRAGRRKLGFFADKALRRLGIVSDDQEFNYASLGTINPNAAQPGVPEYDPVGSGRTVVLSLASPSLDGGSELEGEEDFLVDKSAEDSVSYDLVSKGLLNSPQPGRIDAGWGLPAPVPEEKAADTGPEQQSSLN